MKTARALAFVATATALLSGCGTIINLATDDPVAYGGVQKDVQFALTPNSQLAPGRELSGFLVCFVAADVGVSFLADTLTLPLIIYLNKHREGCVDGGTVIPAERKRAKEPDPKPRDKVEPATTGP